MLKLWISFLVTFVIAMLLAFLYKQTQSGIVLSTIFIFGLISFAILIFIAYKSISKALKS